MNKKLILTCGVAVGVIWAGFKLIQGDSQRETQRIATDISQTTAPVVADPLAMRPAEVLKRSVKPSAEELKARYEQFMANRPLYLADAELPAQYNVDQDGNLIVDGNAKDLLDFFLLTIGDLPFDQIYDLIAGNMIASLQEPARSQALALLDEYFSYIDAYDQWESSFDKGFVQQNDPAGMRDRLAELENLRRQHLGDATYEAFFGELDQVNSAYLEAQLALKQPNLTEQERTDIIANLKSSLPAEVREAQDAAMAVVTLTERTRTLQEKGATEAEIHQARVEMVGEEAARRLAVVDEEKRQWEQKRAQYKALLGESGGLDGMADSERNAYIADIAERELGLSSNEIKRMQALDRIEAAEAVQ